MSNANGSADGWPAEAIHPSHPNPRVLVAVSGEGDQLMLASTGDRVAANRIKVDPVLVTRVREKDEVICGSRHGRHRFSVTHADKRARIEVVRPYDGERPGKRSP
jgi:hypothetical protein